MAFFFCILGPYTGHRLNKVIFIFLYGCEMLMIPHCLDTQLTDGGDVSLMHRSLYTPRNILWYLFLLEAE
jgi:hypothetical protein